MKWFKHYTDSLDDPFIQGLMDEFSHLGYVVFFGLIEIIAKENGNEVTGVLTVSPAYLRRKLRTTPTRVRQVLDYCQTHGRLTADYSGKEWELCFAKIAKIKDNYTKNLQASGKKLSKHKEKEEYKEEKEVKSKKKKEIDLPDWLPLQAWQDFIDMRKSIKAPLKDNAQKLAIAKLDKFREKGDDPEEVLNESTMNSWKGLFRLKDKKGGQDKETTMEHNLRVLRDF